MAERCLNLADWEARALLAGATQIRRPVVPQPEVRGNLIRMPGDPGWHTIRPVRGACGLDHFAKKAPLAVGDVLLGREGFTYGHGLAEVESPTQLFAKWGAKRAPRVLYRCDGTVLPSKTLWRSASQMPRWAVRIQKLVTAVRVERSQDASDQDAFACGLQEFVNLHRHKSGDGFARSAFAAMWDSRHGARHPWAANPWTFVFEVQNEVTP